MTPDSSLRRPPFINLSPEANHLGHEQTQSLGEVEGPNGSVARVYASKPTVSALPWLRPSGLGVAGRSGIIISVFFLEAAVDENRSV